MDNLCDCMLLGACRSLSDTYEVMILKYASTHYWWPCISHCLKYVIVELLLDFIIVVFKQGNYCCQIANGNVIIWSMYVYCNLYQNKNIFMLNF